MKPYQNPENKYYSTPCYVYAEAALVALSTIEKDGELAKRGMEHGCPCLCKVSRYMQPAAMLLLDQVN